MTHSETWLDAVRQVVAAVRASDVTELELANGNFSVHVRRERAIADAQPGLARDAAAANHHAVHAPFTGVFYRSPSPSDRAYVEEGDWVDAEAVIGLVE